MRHYKQLTGEQRYQISGLKKAGLNQSQIVDEVGVHKSTISREFGRNKGRRGWRPRQYRNQEHRFPGSGPKTASRADLR
jgi:IS30 family transposase